MPLLCHRLTVDSLGGGLCATRERIQSNNKFGIPKEELNAQLATLATHVVLDGLHRCNLGRVCLCKLFSNKGVGTAATVNDTKH